MTTGQRIRAARKKAGLTQQELADKLGIAYVGISQWENDKRNPKYETLQRIAKALDISVNDLQDDSYTKALELADAARNRDFAKFEELLGLPIGSLFGDGYNRYSNSNVIDWLLPDDLQGKIDTRTIAFDSATLFDMLDRIENIEFDPSTDANAELLEMCRKAKYALYFIAISSMEEGTLWQFGGDIYSTDEIDAALGKEKKQELILKTRLEYSYSLLSLTGKRKAVERIEELTEIPRYQRHDPTDSLPTDTSEPTDGAAAENATENEKGASRDGK